MSVENVPGIVSWKWNGVPVPSEADAVAKGVVNGFTFDLDAQIFHYWAIAGVPQKTVAEVLAFEADYLAALPDDIIAKAKTKAKANFDDLNAEGRLAVGVGMAARKGDNIMRKWLMDFKDAVANSTTLAQLKAAVALLPSLPPVSIAAAKTVVKNCIDDPAVE